jgi:YYY domain-containing protein
MKKIVEGMYWIFPIGIALSSFYFLGADALYYIQWLVTFILLGWAFLPLSSLIFTNNEDLGYLFSKPLAILLSGLTVWTFSYLRIMPFRSLFIWIVLLAFIAFFYAYPGIRKPFIKKLKSPGLFRTLAFQESLFAASLLLWSFARGLKPLADSLEKPMNYGFMMSLMRTDYLPAADMWYAGGSINYYYFGQYMYTFLTKLSGLSVELTYNLSVAATFAFTLTLSYAICHMLISIGIRRGLSLYKISPATGGLLGAFLVTLAGNSHSFFYGTYYDHTLKKDIFAPGYKLLEIFHQKGWLEKWLPTAEDLIGSEDFREISIKGFWFANSTRFIGYNPTTHDKTIHEFPFYSFLVADLHAHLINLTFVLLFIGLMIVLLDSDKFLTRASRLRELEDHLTLTNQKNWLAKELKNISSVLADSLRDPIIILCGIILGVFMMCNFWDFAVYIVIFAITLLLVNLRGYCKLGSWETLPVLVCQIVLILVPFLLISNPVLAVLGFAFSSILCFILLILSKDSFTITGAYISLVFFISHFLILPFNLNLDSMSKSLAFSVSRTPLFQFLILWGIHILIGLLFLAYIIRRRFANSESLPENQLEPRGRITGFLLGIHPVDLFVCGLFVAGFLFLIMPEIVYVVDIYSGDFKRANTMFKFTYQAFVMLSLVMGYAVARIALTRPSLSKIDFRWSFVAIFMTVLLLIPSFYPWLATGQWLGKFERDRYLGLNAIETMEDKDRLDMIRWMNEHIEGQPVVLESHGHSYLSKVENGRVIRRDYNLVSAYTGLPTVIGWQTHEWLWRTSKTVDNAYGEIVRPRQLDVQSIYEFTNPEKAMELIEAYRIEYIVISSIEKAEYPNTNEDKLLGLGSIIYENDTIILLKLDQ